MLIPVILQVFQKPADKMSQPNYKELKYFFILLKNAYQKKKKFFTYPMVTANLLTVLVNLQKKSLILGYYQLNNQEVKIFLRYDMQSLPAITQIFILPPLRYITVRMLNKFVNDYPYSLGLISTRYGILTVSECKKKNCGGELIVSIT
jgi:ribosomal protein S8